MNQRPAASIKAGLTPLIDVTFLLLVFFIAGIQPAEGELEAYLPKHSQRPCIGHCHMLSELRIKLLWCDLEGEPTRAEQGTVILKIGRKVYNEPGELDGPIEDHEAWRQLYQDIRRYQLNGARDQDFIIDAREQVPQRYVVRALNELTRAGIKEVTFAAPERKY